MKSEEDVTRRMFMRQSAAAAAFLSLCPSIVISKSQELSRFEARYYQKLSGNRIQCGLCPWGCIVEPGKRGKCDVRFNSGGTYYSLVYGRISSNHNDPIEKKPLYHFLPGSMAFSIATAGCNVDCKFCQNWELARRRPESVPSVDFTPEEVITYARKMECTSIAYTYNEPTIFNEYLYDVASEGRRNGIRSVVISNGFISPKPLKDLCRVIDAYKVDLKAFTEEYYQDIVNGRLAPVLDTLTTLKSEGVWTEIVYLIVPTLNDDLNKIREMSQWIVKELGPDVPLHFSRFYPKYKLKNLPPTPVSTLEKARETALNAGLNYVYLGNVPGHEGENTYCPNCKEMLIGRMGYTLFKNQIINGKCGFCRHSVTGVWK